MVQLTLDPVLQVPLPPSLVIYTIPEQHNLENYVFVASWEADIVVGEQEDG